MMTPSQHSMYGDAPVCSSWQKFENLTCADFRICKPNLQKSNIMTLYVLINKLSRADNVKGNQDMYLS